MNLIKYPNEILEREVKDVDLENPGFDPIDLKKEMVDFMIKYNGNKISVNRGNILI